MKKQNNVSSSVLTQIRLGGLFLNNAVQKFPENPVWNGDIPQYDGTAQIAIGDVSAKESAALITWNIVQGMNRWTVRQDNQIMLIADRVLLTNVSWNDLSRNGFTSGRIIKLGGQNFFCHLLPVGSAPSAHNAWGGALHITTTENGVWHWKGVHFWGENINQQMTRCTIRGNTSALAWSNCKADVKSPYIGFRPVLEPMNTNVDAFLHSFISKSNGTSEKKKKTAKKTKQAAVASSKTTKPVAKTIEKAKSVSVSPAAEMLADALHVDVNEAFMMENQRFTIRSNGALWTFDEKVRRWIRVMDVQKIADMVNHCHAVAKAPVFTPEEETMVSHLTVVFGTDWMTGKSVKRAKDGSLQIVDGKDFSMPLNKEAFPSVKPGEVFPLYEAA